ncbi:M48 family metalloprotease [Rhodoferax saidenbachensis]|uniref:Peptidase M48 n=1 Tax=Rhodoferax saidenbachensis TaxID=1484693 RepID=A0A1P8KEM8_9BURK|nr:M48 family metalloprotease [Rhodoferax saidenbachensis]APW44474.1 peptidase M48 [Rhodoferax saidenbachensis]
MAGNGWTQSTPARSSTGLPNLGDGSGMTPSAERKLGDRIARELYRDPDYLDDPVIMEYVQSIWQPLLAAARLRGELPPELDQAYAWELLLGKDRSVNAFALPGAYFGLHLGLVGVVTSRDELASVLAHELSHVTQRHISRLITRQGEQTPWLIGAMILGALAASKNPGAANAAIVGGQAVAAQTQLNFSRDMEREADRVGFGVMSQAGFAPQGFASMFEKLQQASRLNDGGNFPYLRSHPLTTERISDMQSRVPQGAAAVTLGGELDQAMVAARARVLSNTAVDGLRNWALEVEPTRLARLAPYQQAGALYGATLAAIKLRENAAALQAWTRLNELVRNDAAAARLARLLGAELYLAQGDTARAQALLNDGEAKTSRAELFLLTPVRVRTGQAKAASESLQIWLVDHPRDAQAWQLLASAYAAQGRNVASIRAEAEVNVAQLDYASALARFKAAQEQARLGGAGADHFEASIVDTRARQMELLLREQALER